MKATNLFNATGHHACSPTPNKISIDILLPGGGCILSISPCWPLHAHPSSLQCNFQRWSLETWSRSRDASRDPFFEVSVSKVSGLVSVSVSQVSGLRSRLGLGLEGFRSRSRALRLETLHRLVFMKFCKKEFL